MSKSASWSTSGLVIGFIALIAAVMSPWIMDAISPSTKTIDEVAVDVALNIKDRLVAKAKGQEFVAKPKGDKSPGLRHWYPPTTIGVGLLAMCLGIIGFARHEGVACRPLLFWLAKLKCVPSTNKRLQPSSRSGDLTFAESNALAR